MNETIEDYLNLVEPNCKTLNKSTESQGLSRFKRFNLGGQKFSFGIVVIILVTGVLFGYAVGSVFFKSTLNSQAEVQVLYDEKLVTSVFEEASNAVVEINVDTLGFRRTFTGSGFLVDNQGHIITNHHVVDFEGDISVHISDGRILPATKLGTSPADDLALLKVSPGDMTGIDPLHFADSDKIQPGQLAIAIGSPFRQFNAVTVGVVSGVGRSSESVLNRAIPDLVQTDAALNPGNSGGPLLNAQGEVIGVNSSVQLYGGVQTGVGFAVSSNTVKGILLDLMIPGEFKRPWLGISTLRGLSGSDFADLGLKISRGIYVYQVCRDSPADKAGLRGDLHAECFSTGTQRGGGVVSRSPTPTGEADVITAIDGIQIDSVAEMIGHFNELKPGDIVTLTIFRDEEIRDVDIILAPWGGM